MLAAAPVPPAGPYEVVQVFYGTDRLAAELLVDTLPARFVRFRIRHCARLRLDNSLDPMLGYAIFLEATQR